MVLTLEKLGEGIQEEKSKRNVFRKAWRFLFPTFREKLYRNLTASRKERTDPSTKNNISQINQNPSNPVIAHLEKRLMSESYFEQRDNYAAAMELLKSRKMNETSYNSWANHVIEETRNNCDVIGETVFSSQHETDEPYRLFKVPAEFKLDTRTIRDDYGAEGMAIGMMYGKGMKGLEIGSSIPKTRTQRYAKIVSVPVIFSFWDSEGITQDGKSLEEGEKLMITYREIYDPYKCTEDNLPAEDDVLGRVTSRRRLELIGIERA